MPDEIVFVSPGYRPDRRLRQPWCCIYQLACAYRRCGYLTRVLTDEPSRHTSTSQGNGDPTVEYVGSLRGLALGRNGTLERALTRKRTSLVVWNTGLTHLLHAWPPDDLGSPLVGLVASPFHSWRHFANLGPLTVGRNLREAAVHLLASLTPTVLVCRRLPAERFQRVVTLSEVTRQRLFAYGFSSSQVAVIRPGIEPEWIRDGPLSHDHRGSQSGHPIVAYFGDAAEIRGTHILVRAVASLLERGVDLRLEMLLRDRPTSLQIRKLLAVVHKSGMSTSTKLTTGWLSRNGLIERLLRADVIALPFQILPSDAPLSVLEVQALGKPLVSTSVAGLPEITPPLACCRVPPGDAAALAEALATSLRRPEGALGPRWRRTWDDFAQEFNEVAGPDEMLR